MSEGGDQREIRGTFAMQFEHRVLFSDRVLSPSNPLLGELLAAKGRAKAIVFLDSGAAHLAGQAGSYFAARADLLRPPVIIAGGERAKRDRSQFDLAVQVLHDAGLDRHSYCVIVGGGAVLDCAGFAAAVVHRGVRVIRVPTTVLAQNDAGVGVKNGIDAFGKKNFLGTFAPPWAVVNDFALLDGLPARHWRDGTVEAVKVGLIRDAAFFEWIEENTSSLVARDERAFRHLIHRCAELHVRHITSGGDPFELGSARPLDFGHWAAHKIEQLSGFNISHGHAVAVGIAIDTAYAARAGLASEATASRMIRVLAELGFDLSIGKLIPSIDDVMDGLEEFREHLGGELTITLLKDVGQAMEVHEIDLGVMRGCVEDVLLGRVGAYPVQARG